MSKSSVIHTSDFYVVNHYDNDSKHVVICFTSLGGNGAGEPNEEFRHTLKKLGMSSIHVTTRAPDWFNNPETGTVFQKVRDATAGYANVAITGQSMGASGALAFASGLDTKPRMLVFAPQFSVARPFVNFDERYRGHAAKISNYTFLDFGASAPRSDCVIIFGNIDWRDYLHGAMFSARGHEVLTVNGGTHEVAAYLKWSPRGNFLAPLLKAFCDFGAPFDGGVAQSILGSLLGGSPILEGRATVWGESFKAQTQAKLQLPPPPSYENLALRKQASQSSVAPWASVASAPGNSSAAVDGVKRGTPAFYTNYEPNAWWKVDLGARSRIREIRLYNCLDTFEMAARSNLIKAEVADGADGPWAPLFHRTDIVPFGGVDGRPFIWTADRDVLGRYVKLSIANPNCLHLDEVEIYGDVA